MAFLFVSLNYTNGDKKETLGITLFFLSISFLIFCLFSKFFATKKNEYLYEISMKLIEFHALF
ncbi:hypothetical protein CYQ64_09620 [Enterococcus faecium]|nr:hypothetical protein CYQ64_09620 [Enterococcus faecium]TKP13116.1 hypothetical protein DVY26_12155 [Enterococcus faecium]